MKRTVLTTFCLALLYSAVAKPPTDTTSSRSNSLEEILNEIISVTGLQPSFTLKEADVMNMEAQVSKHKRVILYNPSFINWLYRSTHDKWAAATLLAHEIGHHLNGHTLKRGVSKPDVELEADEYAGFVMFKLGASLQQAQEVMKYIATSEGSATHPPRSERMKAVERGWERGRGQ